MDFTHKAVDGILYMTFEGDLIGENNGPELMSIVQDNLAEGTKLSAIDISGIRYINSSGIGVLITILTKLRNKDGELCLINPSEQVKKLLIITKLNAIFQIVSNKEEAVKLLKSK